ncbi:MAG TPA: VOC family protein [Nocardioides sp.]|nr:VOC family protein [Nocardioides sp.]
MTSRLTELVIDCADPVELARFWTAALDYVVVDESPEWVEIGPAGGTDEERLAEVRLGPTHATIYLVRVPEGKVVKNRVHLDISPVDTDQDTEVARLEGLGARRTDLAPADKTWVVMLDPEGNEFCVMRSLAPGHFSL